MKGAVAKCKAFCNSPFLSSLFLIKNLFCLCAVIRHALLQRFLHCERQGIRIVHRLVAIHMEEHHAADAEADGIGRFIRHHGGAVVIIVKHYWVTVFIRIIAGGRHCSK